MSTLKENMLTLVAVIVAIVAGLTLQFTQDLPILATSIIGVGLGILAGYIVYLITVFVNKRKNKQK